MTLLFYYLIILNLLDGALTWFGLKYALISELNPLMHAIYEINPLVFILAKAALSISLLLFILLKKVPRSFLIKGLTVFVSATYTAVFCLHGFWLVQIV